MVGDRAQLASASTVVGGQALYCYYDFLYCGSCTTTAATTTTDTTALRQLLLPYSVEDGDKAAGDGARWVRKRAQGATVKDGRCATAQDGHLAGCANKILVLVRLQLVLEHPPVEAWALVQTREAISRIGRDGLNLCELG